jgi:hypothetical protein
LIGARQKIADIAAPLNSCRLGVPQAHAFPIGCERPPPRRQENLMLRNTIAAAMLLAFVVPASPASAPADAALKELRQTFTVHGKPIPPETADDFRAMFGLPRSLAKASPGERRV